MKTILCVDDEIGTRESIRAVFEGAYRVLLARDVAEARDLVAREIIDIVLLDQALPEVDGLSYLAELKSSLPKLPVIMITALNSENTLTEALNRGAVGLVAKPFDVHALRHLVEQSIGAAQQRCTQAIIRKGIETQFAIQNPIGTSSIFQKALRAAEELSKFDAPILVSGDRGCGKELVARHIHLLQRRTTRPFCCVHHSLNLEEELFGPADGSSPDDTGIIGLGTGTIYLDGAEQLTGQLLARLGEYCSIPLGSKSRLIFGTHLPDTLLERAPHELKKILAQNHVRIPTLRERSDDIPLLSHHFLNEFHRQNGSEMAEIGAESMRCLRGYYWPGNVRELRNVIERASLVYGPERELQPAHLPKEISLALPTSRSSGHTYDEMIEEFEKAMIIQALSKTSGNVTKAAELLGSTPRIISLRINSLNLRNPIGDVEGK